MIVRSMGRRMSFFSLVWIGYMGSWDYERRATEVNYLRRRLAYIYRKSGSSLLGTSSNQINQKNHKKNLQT